MKTRKIYVVMVCLLGICITGNTYAQTSVNKASLFSGAANRETAKEINSSNAMVSLKVKEGFKRNFGENKEQYWSVVGKNYVSHFYAGGFRVNAMFNKNGRLIYTVKYGTAEQLPGNYKKIVKARYPEHNISMVTHVQEDDVDVWIVQVQDDIEVVTTRIADETLEQVNQFYKSK